MKIFKPYRKRIITTLACIFLLLSGDAVYAQQAVNKIAESLTAHNESGIKEKIFVHTDKDFYQTGEIIWFKSYCTDAVFHKPLDVSKVAYIEILDNANKPALQAKVALHNAEGEGSFYLPQTIVSGNYKLRAYTNWMKNFDADWFFEKHITIVNVKKTPDAAETKPKQFSIQFFPEGGNLVNGLQSKVAFKAVADNGNGYNFTGYILDNTDTLLRIAPNHSGMGHFMFTPAAGHNYKAYIKPYEGTAFYKELPTAYSNGFVLGVTETENGNIKAVVTTNTPSANKVYLIAHTRSSIKIASEALLQNGKTEFSIDKFLLGDGISHITIFNDSRQPVCERLYFKYPVNTLPLNIATAQTEFEKRKEVVLNINSTQLSDEDKASLSMSIFKLDSLQKINEDNNIQTYLLLTSDLKGYIENPAFYFSGNNKNIATATDDLLLTQGWRRFRWEVVLNNEKSFFEFAPEARGHIITGKVINTNSRQPAAAVMTYLGAPSVITQFNTSLSDNTGVVKFEISNFYGGSSVVAMTNPLVDSQYIVKIDDPFSKKFSAVPVPVFNKPNKYPNTLLQQNMSMQVQNIYAGNKMNEFYFPSFADTAAFYVNPDFRYDLDNYTRFTTIEEVLREYVVLVNVRRKNKQVLLPIVNVNDQQYFPGQPINLLDGVPVFDFNKFFEFDPLKIKSLDVIAQRYIYGNSIFDGILNWKTYKPSLSNYSFPPTALALDYEGLQLHRDFYNPSYDSDVKAQSRVPDYRNVLYWKPDIKLQGNKAATVKFYTSDIVGKYAVVIQGLSAKGAGGSRVITFEVR